MCQSWESKGQLSVIAMIGRIMGCGDRAKGFSVVKDDGLALSDPLGEGDTCAQCFPKAPTIGWISGGRLHRQQPLQQ